MSWGEVKKINSDLSVPLDERAKYIAGIIPRNTIPKTITPEANNGVVYEYSGKTIINSLSFSVSVHHTDYSMQYGTYSGTCTIKVYSGEDLICTNSVSSSVGSYGSTEMQSKNNVITTDVTMQVPKTNVYNGPLDDVRIELYASGATNIKGTTTGKMTLNYYVVP